MENLDNMRVEENNLQNDTNVDYIAAIEELKSNSVSKNDYLKLKNENKQLLDTLVKGGQYQGSYQKPITNVKELRKELFNPDGHLNNLEYATKALELRDAVMEAGGNDPFLPTGINIIPSEEDLATANRVAQVLKNTIEYADGNSEIFTNELQRIMVDSAPIKRK